MSEVHNVDAILVPREQAMLANETIPPQPADPEISSISADPKPEVELAAPIAPEIEAIEPEAPEPVETPTEASDSPIDEYGNPIEKPRMYTEEEVNQRIRERLARGKFAEMPQQQTQQAAKDFTPDPNSEETWETQLEAFVEKTIEKRQQKLSQQEWQDRERAKQADFETRFTTGMSKYQDFHKVVEGKKITNDMMMATRGLDNPAAFIYGAAKLHPQELARIAQISDPYTQAAEVGRLHERMVKTRNAATKAAKPLEAVKGDVPVNRTSDRPNLDALIKQHEKTKFIGNKR
jgi:hypothetical protein